MTVVRHKLANSNSEGLVRQTETCLIGKPVTSTTLYTESYYIKT